MIPSSPTIVLTVFRKELLETFRDRKSVLLAILLPILLYPGLLLLLTQVSASHQAELESEASRVHVMHADDEHPLVRELRDWDDLDVIVHGEGPVEVGDREIGIDLEGWSRDPLATHDLRIYFRSVDDRAQLGLERVQRALEAWADDTVAQRLRDADLPPSLADPLRPELIDTSADSERGGHLLASLVPIFLLLTLSIGMLSPAVDLTAGERERSTLQTLFTAPVQTLDIVLGKAGALIVMGLLTGAANLASIALLFQQQSFLAGGLGDLEIALRLPDLVALAIAMCLLASLLAAFFLAVALLGQDTKEAQSFISPAYLLTVLPAVVVQLPGFELNALNATVPVVNGVLLVKGILMSGASLEPLLLVTASTLVQVMLLLAFAAWLLGHEGILTGRATQLRWFVPRRARQPRSRPTTAEALVWYGVSFALLFYVGATLQARAPQPGLLATLWGLLLAPTLAWAWYQRLDLRATFRLRPPAPDLLAASALLGSSVFVLFAWAQHASGQGFQLDGEAAEQMAEQLAAFFPRPTRPIESAWLFFVVGVSPAICEEVLFRGYVLSGLRQKMRPVAAVTLTALLFALFHMSAARLPGTFALGLIMGALALLSRSLWPAIVFHALNNGLLVLLAYRLEDPSQPDADPFTPLRMPALLAAAAGCALVAWAVRRQRRAPAGE